MTMRGKDEVVQEKCFMKPTLAFSQLFYDSANQYLILIQLPFVKPTLALHQLFYDDER